MHYVSFMQLFNTICYFFDHSQCLQFIEWLLWLLADIVEQITCWHELSDDEDGLTVLEVLDKLKDVGAPELSAFLKYLNLLEDLLISRE